MKLREALHAALDALMYVNFIGLVINNHYSPDIRMWHLTHEEDGEFVHKAEILYYSDIPNKMIEAEVEVWPFREVLDFDKLPELDPEQEGWDLWSGSMTDLKEARKDLNWLIGVFEHEHGY